MGKTCQAPCVVLFDGVCSFCDRFVQWIVPRDPEGACRLVASQSPAGEAMRERFGISQSEVEASIYVIAGGRVYNRSSAIMAIAARLVQPWRIIAWARVVPMALRDWVYDIVSANRYRWFGKRGSCRLPTPEEQSRFLQEAVDVARHFGEGRPERASRQNP